MHVCILLDGKAKVPTICYIKLRSGGRFKMSRELNGCCLHLSGSHKLPKHVHLERCSTWTGNFCHFKQSSH
uniref:B3 domain-containing protein Os07g0563300 n=1 Tax=Rhizophora mucronata TaxID=61149 RepID=A0A2P2PKQ3_RHIMU